MLSAADLLAAAFPGLPAAWTIGLLVAALAAVTALHLLRTRPVPRRVASILFWSAATSAARPRQLGSRLRQALSWLIFAAFAAGVVLALSTWIVRASANGGRAVVVVLDAGLSMGAPGAGGGTRLDAGRLAAQDILRTCAEPDEVALVVVDPAARAVHRFDQPAVAAPRALREVRAAAVPADHAGGLRLAAALAADHTNARVYWVTDAAGAEALTRELTSPLDVRIVRVGAAQDNGAVLSAVYVPDEARADVGRVAVEIGWWGRMPARLRITGRVADRVVLDAAQELTPGETIGFDSDLLAADGRVAEIVLDEPTGVAADNHVRVPLPDVRPIAVALDEDTPAALRLAVAAVPGVRIVAPEARATLAVVGRLPGEAWPEDPALVVWEGAAGVRASGPIAVAGESALTAGLQFDGARAGTGPWLNVRLENQAHVALLTAGGAVLAAALQNAGGNRYVLLSSALFADDSTVPGHPALALLIARAVRELAGRTPPAWCVPAGRSVQDPVWARRQGAERPTYAAAGSRDVSDLAPNAAARAAAPPSRRWLPAWTALLLLALALLVLEAALNHRNRIP